MAMSYAPHLQLFFGETSAVQCRVYARLDAPVDEDFSLTGLLVGPECQYGHTLPIRYPFVALRRDRPPLAEAFIAEPCFWSADMPHLYRAEIEVRRGQQVVERVERWFGIRPLGARPRTHGTSDASGQASLVFAGNRYVIRAVHRDHVPTTELGDWREQVAAMIVRDPEDALCEEASRVGVLLIAEVDGSTEECRAEIRRLAHWPAVGVVIVESRAAACAQGIVPPNLLMAQVLETPDAAPADGASVVVCSAEDVGKFEAVARNCPLPVLARRSAKRQATLGDARRLCDILQRDLAPLGQFAGYLV
jgi:hypothetical protein